VRTPIQLLRTEEGDLTDIAVAINRFLINRMEHIAADIDDGTSRPSSCTAKPNCCFSKLFGYYSCM